MVAGVRDVGVQPVGERVRPGLRVDPGAGQVVGRDQVQQLGTGFAHGPEHRQGRRNGPVVVQRAGPLRLVVALDGRARGLGEQPAQAHVGVRLRVGHVVDHHPWGPPVGLGGPPVEVRRRERRCDSDELLGGLAVGGDHPRQLGRSRGLAGARGARSVHLGSSRAGRWLGMLLGWSPPSGGPHPSGWCRSGRQATGARLTVPVRVNPQRTVWVWPGARRISPSPVRNASAAHVMGSAAKPLRW